MRKLSPVAYRSLFFKHVWAFMRKIASPFELEGNHVVAVSGGRDSMALLWVLNALYKQGKLGPLRVINIDHNSRPGQKLDAELVRDFCEKEGLPFKVLITPDLGHSKSNFENRARQARRQISLQDLKKDELLWVGHHIDDSYEWSIMQRNRSTSLRSIHGIPVRNGPIIRPFNCVTRAQIKKLVRNEQIPFREDPTNKDPRFDRNYVRHQIVPFIEARFPKYLKHYVNNSNFQTLLLKLNVLQRGGASQIYAFDQGAVLIGKHFPEIQVQELLHTYSNADRGEIITPIQRMLKAIDNGKKGPFHFSGGLEAYHAHNLLMIYPQKMKNYDEAISRVLSSLPLDILLDVSTYKRIELEQSWQHVLKATDALCNMPGLVLCLESESVCKTLNCSVFDKLFPLVSAVCQQRGLRFISYTKLLETWATKKEKLPEKLRLLPLNNLSNLFSSQQ